MSVSEQKNLLVAELAALDRQIGDLEEALKVKPEYGMGKGDPAITQWELDQALLKRLRRHAGQLREALARFEEGTYGICRQCGKAINPERLAILPDTTICVDCARKR
jgi:RNA polymerase-binding transcription factor DksA